jgi:hypothetical protein
MKNQILMGVIRRISKLLFLCVVTGNANANVVTWTFQNAFWEDGGTITGSFDYDADIDTYSNVSITTTDGNGTPTIFGGAYNGSAHLGSGNTTLVLYSDTSTHPLDVAGELRLDLAFYGPAPDYAGFTNAGGTLTVDTISAETICLVTPCGFGEKDDRAISSGTVIGAVVPVPPALWLFGSGLLGLIGIARRKKAA